MKQKYNLFKFCLSPFVILYRVFFLIVVIIFFSKIKKILFIGQTHSPHFLAFKKQFDKNCNSKVLAFYISSYPVFTKKISPFCVDLYSYCLMGKDISSTWEFNLYQFGIIENLNLIKITRFIIKVLKPNLLWIHDLQSGGYLLNEAIDLRKNSIPIILTTYGNDLYFYKGNKLHVSKISKILRATSLIHVETKRDVSLALKYGYRGHFLPVTSATLKVYSENLGVNSYQKDIDLLIKGSYKNRSQLDYFYNLCKKNANYFKSLKIVIFSSSQFDIENCNLLRNIFGVNIKCIGTIPQSELFSLMQRSLCHLTITLSDGLANTCTESILYECIPFVTIHNGFVELINSRYRYLLVYKPCLGLPFLRNLVYIRNNGKLRNEILLSIHKNIKKKYSQSNIDSYFKEIRKVNVFK
jgi:hypothetical protein